MSAPKSPINIEMLLEVPGVEPKITSFTFQQNIITIGRDDNSDIQIPLSTASRNHALIKHEEGQWYVEDLKSTHGTERNGTHLGAGGIHLFRPGDTLKIIHMTLTFLAPEKVTPSEIPHENPSMAAINIVDDLMANLGGQQDLPYLRVMNGPAEGQKFDIRPDLTEALIGRADECHFQINDANVSRQHAKIHRDWNDITLHDLGSKNGVLVNNKRIGKGKRLKDTDQILLGAVRLTFVDPTAAILQTLEGLPAFAREEESIDSALLPGESHFEENDNSAPGLGVPQEDDIADDDALDEKSVATPLDSLGQDSTSDDDLDMSGISSMLTPQENGTLPTNESTPASLSSSLSTAEKSLIGLSAFVFLALIAGVLIFVFLD